MILPMRARVCDHAGPLWVVVCSVPARASCATDAADLVRRIQPGPGLRPTHLSEHPKAAVASPINDGPSKMGYLGVAVLGVAVLGTAVLQPGARIQPGPGLRPSL